MIYDLILLLKEQSALNLRFLSSFEIITLTRHQVLCIVLNSLCSGSGRIYNQVVDLSTHDNIFVLFCSLMVEFGEMHFPSWAVPCGQILMEFWAGRRGGW